MRQIFISDCHIGSVFAKPRLLHDFLTANSRNKDDLFLLGDIFDLWKTDPKHEVFQWFSGYRNVFYTPGNHDDEMFCARILSPYVVRQALLPKNNKQVLITHGDVFDPRYGADSFWNRVCDGVLYRLSRFINTDIRKWFDPLKRKYYTSMDAYRKRVLDHLNTENVDTIVFGHTHVPEHTQVGSKLLINLGSWDGTPHVLVSEGDRYAFFEVTTTHLVAEEKDFDYFW